MKLKGDMARAYARVWVQAALSISRGKAHRKAYGLSVAAGSRINRLIRAVGAEAEEQEMTVIDISRRRASELCNLDEKRCFRWLDALTEEGFLRCVFRAKPRDERPSRWELTLPIGVDPGAYDPDRPIIADVIDDPAIDLWHGVRGTAVNRIWSVMSEESPMTSAEIAAKVDITEQAVGANLRALAAMEPPLALKLVRHHRDAGVWRYGHPETGQFFEVKVTGSRPPSLWLQLRPDDLGALAHQTQVAKRRAKHRGDRDALRSRKEAVGGGFRKPRR